jgi:hypothetical protein
VTTHSFRFIICSSALEIRSETSITQHGSMMARPTETLECVTRLLSHFDIC